MRIILNKKTFFDFFGKHVTSRTKKCEYKIVKLLRKHVKDAGQNEKKLQTHISRTARQYTQLSTSD